MAKDMWDVRDRPLLEAIAEADVEGRAVAYSTELANRTGLSARDTQAGLRALYEAGMIEGSDAATEP